MRPGVTGFLFPAGDSANLAFLLSDLMKRRDLLLSMRPACRAIAEREYSMELQAVRYCTLYESLNLPIDNPNRC